MIWMIVYADAPKVLLCEKKIGQAFLKLLNQFRALFLAFGGLRHQPEGHGHYSSWRIISVIQLGPIPELVSPPFSHCLRRFLFHRFLLSYSLISSALSAID